MNVFELRNHLVNDYAAYVGGFINIGDDRIRDHVTGSFEAGRLWPDPLIQLNPSFELGQDINQLVDADVLHPECANVFRKGKTENGSAGSKVLQLYRHQEEAIHAANTGANYVLTTGTGSGKSLSYIIPIVNHVLHNGSGKGVQAIIVYPMNALANSQCGELKKFLTFGYPGGNGPVTFKRYTGQEGEEERKEIVANPPDIILTNYVMLELMLTRPFERDLIRAAQGLRFLVLDELHTYRGRQGADVALLVRRVREALSADSMQCVGTSATLASGGSYEEQRAEVARVATTLFGAEVTPNNVIGETLQRATPDRTLDDPEFVDALRQRIEDTDTPPPTAFNEFVQDPLSVWIESTFGITREAETERLVRCTPSSISGDNGAAKELAALTGLDETLCRNALERGLLAGYTCEPDPATGFKPFAFRLHQFISRGDRVYASLEDESERYITLNAQQFVPGDRNRILLPLVFCRECGHEVYCVRKTVDPETGLMAFESRELSDRLSDEDGEAGFLYFNSETPWPDDPVDALDKLPEDWLETVKGVTRIKRHYRKDLPQPLQIAPDGKQAEHGRKCHFIGAPFRFCMNCGVAYGSRQSSDFAKLASLATEGRSTATTVLALSAILQLKNEDSLPVDARKLLSFTDNRQDASLQAGHFNDFVEIGLLRSALFRAASDAGANGLKYDEMPRKVFDALDLPLELYARDPSVRFQPKLDTERALREVIAYRLYHDLRRGWRITAPNLEQCGLLEIEYQSLDEFCAAEDIWENTHPALVDATPEVRHYVAKTLLDYMRRSLCLDVDFLSQAFQERMVLRSSQRLKPPWAIDEDEKALVHSSWLVPRSSRPGDYGGNVNLSPRGGFGTFLRRKNTFPDYTTKLTLEETGKIATDLLEALAGNGFLTKMQPDDDVTHYQLPASLIVWRAGDGQQAFHDPIRIPRQPEEGCRTNPFFVEFYRTVASALRGLEAHEHTAQVPNDIRIEREESFKKGDLSILFCSPTMELGVDIAQLNVVNLRNVPPTPANYAQRSGRAGRGGQPALVFSYCATGNSHDQYFFKRPQLMVAGAVSPPRLDLGNEDLVRSHVHAVWLAETRLDLGKSLRDVLDVNGEPPSLQLQEHVSDDIRSPLALDRATHHARKVLNSVLTVLGPTDWYCDEWLSQVLTQSASAFDRACDRWRSLYLAAHKQREIQNHIIGDASRSARDKEQAKRLRREAEAQMELLLEAKHVIQSDFYSYRYFASEGFLPGYNFPRLPLSAFIPARRGQQRDEFLSRSRFLAISEFGPKAMVYHEGSKYVINKVILPVEPTGDVSIATMRIKQCPVCGYIHPIEQGEGLDLCERCDHPLETTLRDLFRLQNVSTRRRDKINCDEEERLRLGYELRTGLRFAERGGLPSFSTGTVQRDDEDIAKLTYGHAATIWRINLGWARREKKNQYGFVLDVERGYWGSNKLLDDQNPEDPMSPNCARVIPYVEDRKNCLLFEWEDTLSETEFFSLQSALKNAIQVQYQLEESEIAAEPLPDKANPRVILFYEAAEGGAGVLRHLLDTPEALAEVATEALRICHFDPATGDDLRMAPGATEECEAACYNCLMTYSNQSHHDQLDRQTIKDILMNIAGATVKSGPSALPRPEHLQRLMRLCQSDLERDWLKLLEARNLRLPTDAQKYVYAGRTCPDFVYEGDYQAAIYIDGPVHDYPERQERDSQQMEMMEDDGWIVIRFRYNDDWEQELSRYPNIFGWAEDAR